MSDILFLVNVCSKLLQEITLMLQKQQIESIKNLLNLENFQDNIYIHGNLTIYKHVWIGQSIWFINPTNGKICYYPTKNGVCVNLTAVSSTHMIFAES